MPQPRDLLTEDEYLRQERAADFKSEYVNGSVYAMAGARVNHNRIAGNLNRLMGNQLAGRPCEVFNSDMKVRIDKANAFRYPDLSGLCGPMVFHDEIQDAYCNPSIIIEVLSPSTEAQDRGEKFNLYRLLNSLQEYVLIRQDRVEVEVFQRDANGMWTSVVFNELTDVICLRSLDCRLLMADIYERVSFE